MAASRIFSPRTSLLLGILPLLLMPSGVWGQLLVGEVIERIQGGVPCKWQSETVDRLKAGRLDQEVTGIAVSFMATLAVLQEAQAQGCNLIITHEPTFYNHFDDRGILAGDPVQAAKIEFIEDHDLAIFRFHDHWHCAAFDGIDLGMVRTLGWQDRQVGEEMIFSFPETTVQELATQLATTFETGGVRVVGDPYLPVQQLGMVPGAAPARMQISMLQDPRVNTVLVGESREWETVEYVRDANEAGIPLALIILGHADSEEGGMAFCAEWLRELVQEVPIQFLPAGNPLWNPLVDP